MIRCCLDLTGDHQQCKSRNHSMSYKKQVFHLFLHLCDSKLQISNFSHQKRDLGILTAIAAVPYRKLRLLKDLLFRSCIKK